MYTGPAMVLRISNASGEDVGPSYVAKRSLVSITNGSPGWTRRTGGCVALKLVQSWSLVTLCMIVSPLQSRGLESKARDIFVFLSCQPTHTNTTHNGTGPTVDDDQ